jgi:phospholipid/cholesterol/gamma-HCH transport system permease protein
MKYSASQEAGAGQWGMDFSRSSENILVIRLTGNWNTGSGLPSAMPVAEQIRTAPGVSGMAFDSKDLARWDSGLLTFVMKVLDICAEQNIRVQKDGLPEGARRLLELARSVPEKKDARPGSTRVSRVTALGQKFLAVYKETGDMLRFIGEASLALGRFFLGKARFRKGDLFLYIQECGPQALPIITLISVLVGLILAFVGAIQLQMFGAEIYVANLVGLGMAREMGAMMAAIIMAGRTGAAYAAQLGTMQVNQEIDALSTLGISPMEFLVLPRMTAMALMMPLLCIYADLMGILGGAIVGIFMLDISPATYLYQTQTSVSLHHFSTGLIKSVIFGLIVAFCGCLRGIQSGRSASAVGEAATSAVVLAIVMIVVSDALFTVIFSILNI